MLHSRRPRVLAALCASASVFALAAAPATGQDAEPRPVIASSSEVPRFAYEVSAAPSALVTADALVTEYAPRLRADLQGVLDGYEITDAALQRELIGMVSLIDLMLGDADAALAGGERRRALADKPSDGFMANLLTDVFAEAGADGDIGAILAGKLEAMPFEVVQEDVEGLKGNYEILSPALLTGLAESRFDDGAAKTGTISRDILSALITYRGVIDIFLPRRDALVSTLGAYIDANKVVKPDIWAARDLDLTGREDLTPVTIAVWDSGVDTPLFAEQLWTNADETANGADDDGNGFVDDVNGIAYNLDAEKVSELLHPLDAASASEEAMRADIKGWIDVSANLDTPEAAALKQKMSELQQDAVEPFITDLNIYSNYSHGTHVAGIVLEGNPAAALLSARLTFDYRVKPLPYLEEDAAADAKMSKETVAYFQDAGVRVVNMSWGGSPEYVEYALEVNGLEEDPDARRERAEAIFAIARAGFEEAVASAPEILFIAAAGNSDENVEFSQFYPSGTVADNLIAVGAVDQAGDETGFTSYGPTVVLHANGYEVVSEVPGGEELAFSGTSMAAPNAANLAGKLLAIDPDLTVAELIAVMRETAETTDDGRRFLIHPQAAAARIAATEG